METIYACPNCGVTRKTEFPISDVTHDTYCPDCNFTIREDEPEVADDELHEIARLIQEGYTSGILDSEGYRVSWSLKMDKFKN